MQKHFQIFLYAAQALLRHKTKHTMLVLVFAFVVTFYGSVVLFGSALKSETERVFDDLPELWVQRLLGGRLSPGDTSLLRKVENIRGVKRVYPRVWGYFFDEATGAVLTLTAADSSVQDLSVIRMPGNKLPEDKEAYCGEGLLRLRGLEVGDYLSLPDPEGNKIDFRIAGSFTADTELLTTDLIVLPPVDARKLLGLQAHEFTDMALEVHNPEESENIARKIDNQDYSLRVVSLSQIKSTYKALFSRRSGIFIYGAAVVLLAFLILVWEKAMGLSRDEKQELGILKGLGWQISDVLSFKLWQALLLSLSAGLAGILLSYVHVFVLNAPLLKPFLTGWSVLFPSYDLLPVLRFSDIVSILFLSVIPYLSAALIPAWYGAVTDPADVMRQG